MFNLNFGCSPIKKADNSAVINTNMLRSRTSVSKEDLSKVKVYSSIGSQQSITEAMNNSKVPAKKEESVDPWEGLLTGLFG